MYLNTPTTILGNYFGTFIKTGLYTIRPDATVYMGKDDSGNSTYVPCFCKAIAILYSNTFINNQNDLSKLAGPESGELNAGFQCISNFFPLFIKTISKT